MKRKIIFLLVVVALLLGILGVERVLGALKKFDLKRKPDSALQSELTLKQIKEIVKKRGNKEEQIKDIEQQNRQFWLAKGIIQKIEKGSTTKRKISVWFGQPSKLVDGETLTLEGEPDSFLKLLIGHEAYSAPKPNQEVAEYHFWLIRQYSLKRVHGWRGKAAILLITFDKETGIIEDFYHAENDWGF